MVPIRRLTKRTRRLPAEEALDCFLRTKWMSWCWEIIWCDGHPTRPEARKWRDLPYGEKFAPYLKNLSTDIAFCCIIGVLIRGTDSWGKPLFDRAGIDDV